MQANAERLLAATSGVGEAEFLRNDILQLAAERLLQNIGESARRIAPTTRAHYDAIPWSSIIGQRNVLVHEYGDVKPALVWRTVTRDLPALLATLRAILAESDATGSS